MNTEDRRQALDGDTRKLLHYLDLALGSIEAGPGGPGGSIHQLCGKAVGDALLQCRV